MKKSLKSIPHSDSLERVDGSLDDASDKIDEKKPSKVSTYIVTCFYTYLSSVKFIRKYKVSNNCSTLLL